MEEKEIALLFACGGHREFPNRTLLKACMLLARNGEQGVDVVNTFDVKIYGVSTTLKEVKNFFYFKRSLWLLKILVKGISN